MSINVLERIMREIRRRTRVVGNFPDGKSAVMLVAARLRHIAGTKWGRRVYLDMARLCESELEQAAIEMPVALTADFLFPRGGIKADEEPTRRSPVPGTTQNQMCAP